jgi:hypothetical protein
MRKLKPQGNLKPRIALIARIGFGERVEKFSRGDAEREMSNLRNLWFVFAGTFEV